MAGNTDKKINPFWGKWAIFEGKTRRPGRVQDGHDERQPRRRGVRLRRPTEPTRRFRRSPSASGWATATTHPTTASSRSTRPRRSGRRSSRKSPRVRRSPSSSRRPSSRPPPSTRSPASSPARSRRRPSRSCSCPARSRPRRRRSGSQHPSTRRAACYGATAAPDRGSRAATSTSRRSSRISRRGRRRMRRGAPARPGAPASGAARRGRERRTSTTERSPRSVGRGARRSSRRALCPLYTPPVYCDPFAFPTPIPSDTGRDLHPAPHGSRRGDRTPRPFNTPRPTKTPNAGSELDDRRAVAAFAPLAGSQRLHQRVVRCRRADGVADRAGPMPWMISALSSPASPASSR